MKYLSKLLLAETNHDDHQTIKCADGWHCLGSSQVQELDICNMYERLSIVYFGPTYILPEAISIELRHCHCERWLVDCIYMDQSSISSSPPPHLPPVLCWWGANNLVRLSTSLHLSQSSVHLCPFLLTYSPQCRQTHKTESIRRHPPLTSAIISMSCVCIFGFWHLLRLFVGMFSLVVHVSSFQTVSSTTPVFVFFLAILLTY